MGKKKWRWVSWAEPSAYLCASLCSPICRVDKQTGLQQHSEHCNPKWDPVVIRLCILSWRWRRPSKAVWPPGFNHKFSIPWIRNGKGHWIYSYYGMGRVWIHFLLLLLLLLLYLMFFYHTFKCLPLIGHWVWQALRSVELYTKILSRIGVTYKSGFGLDGWIYWHTLQFTVTHGLVFSVFTSRILATHLLQSHCHFKSHMKSSFQSLIPFLPIFCNCQFRKLDSIKFLCPQAHIPAGWSLETLLSTLYIAQLNYSLWPLCTDPTESTVFYCPILF
jgi:hypothetical protein